MSDLQPTGYKAIMDASDWNRGVADILQSNAKLTASLDAMTAEMTKGGKNMGEGIEKGTRQAGSAYQSLGKTIAGVAIGNIITSAVKSGIGALQQLGGSIMSLATESAAIPQVADAFERMGGSIESMRAGSAGLVTDIDLMKSYNQAVSLVSKDFAQQLPEAMGLLNKAAASTGQSVSFFLDSLVKGVGRVSPMILDNLGVQVNLTEATEAYAKKIGVAADAMSKQQQQAAVMELTMSKLQGVYGGLADVSDSAAAKQAAFGTAMANFKNEVGVSLLPVLGSLQQVLGAVTSDVLPALKPIIDDIAGRMTDWASALASDIVPRIQDVATALGQLASGNVQGAIEAVFGSANAAKIQGFMDGLRQFGDTVNQVLGFFGLLDNIDLGTFVTTLGALALAWGALNVVMNANPFVLVATGVVLAAGLVAKAVGEIKTAQAELAAGTSASNAALVQTTQTYAEYQQAALAAALEQGRISDALGMENAMRGALRTGLILTEEQYYAAAEAARMAGAAAREAANGMLAGSLAARGVNTDMAAAAAASEKLAATFAATTYNIDDMLGGMGQSAKEAADAFIAGFEGMNEATIKSATDIQKLVADHAQKLADIEQGAADKRRDAAFTYNLSLAQAEQAYQQERAALVAQGATKELADLDAKFQQQQATSANQYAINQQLAERAKLVELVNLQRAHVQELQMRQDQARLTLLTEMQKSDQWKELTALEQSAIVAKIYEGGSERLQKEAEFAQQSLIIQQTATGKRLGIVSEELDVLAAMQAGQVDAAKAALDKAEANLASFNIELPPLPALDTSKFAASTGGVGKAVEGTKEAATRTMASVVEDIDKTVNTALNMLYKLTDLQIPSTAQEALGKLGEFIKAQVGFVYSLQIDLKNTKPLEKISKALSLLMDAFVQFISVGTRLTANPPTLNMDAYVQFFVEFGTKMILMTKSMEDALGGGNAFKKTIQNAKRVGEFFKTIATFFERIGATRMPDMTAWSVQLETAIRSVMQIVEGLIRDFGATDIQRAAELAAPLEALAGVLRIEFDALKKINLRGISTWKRDFKIAIMEVLDLVQSLIKELGGFQINQAAGYVENLSSLLSLLATELSVATREAGWQEELPEFIDDLFFAVIEIETAITDLGWEIQQDMADAVKVAESVTALAALLGTSLEVAKTGNQWPAQMELFLDRLFMAAESINARITNLGDDVQEQMVVAAQFAQDIQGLVNLLQVKLTIDTGPSNWDQQIIDFVDRLFFAVQHMRSAMASAQFNWIITQGFQTTLTAVGQQLIIAADLAKSIKELASLLDINTDFATLTYEWVGDVHEYAKLLFEGIADPTPGSNSIYDLIARMDQAVKDALPDAADLADNITKLAGLLSIDLTLDTGGDTWAADIIVFVEHLQTATHSLETMINDALAGLHPAIATAVPLAENVKKLAGLLQVKLTLDTGGRNWAADIVTFVNNLGTATTQLNDKMQELILGNLTDAIKASAAISEDVEKLVGLLGTGLDFKLPENRNWKQELPTYLEDMREAWEAIKDKLKDNALAIEDDIKIAAALVDPISKLISLLGLNLSVSLQDGFSTKLGPFLDQIKDSLAAIVLMLDDLADDFVFTDSGIETIIDLIDEHLPLVEKLQKMLGLLGVNLDVKPAEFATFGNNLTEYASQLKFAVGWMATEIDSISDPVKEAIANAAPLAGDMEKLTKLLGVDLSKVMPSGAGNAFSIALKLYSMQLISALTDPEWGMVALVKKVIAVAGSAEELATQADAAGSIGTILDLLSFKDLLGTMASTPPESVFTDWIAEYVANLKIAVKALMDPALGLPSISDEFGTGLAVAKQTAETIKGIFDAIFAVADSISKAWTAITPPGLDVTAVEDTLAEYEALITALDNAMGMGRIPASPPSGREDRGDRGNESPWGPMPGYTPPLVGAPPPTFATPSAIFGPPSVPVAAGGGGGAGANAQPQANLNGTVRIVITRGDTGEDVYVREVDLAALVDDILAEAEVTA